MPTDMAQTEICFESQKIQPHVGTQAHKLLMAMYRGEHLTVAKALNEYGVYALSQRVGELKKLGWPIQDRTVPGHKHSEYWIDFQ